MRAAALPVAAIALATACPAAAQEIPPDPPPQTPAATPGNANPADTAKDVYIGDSAELAERFQLASRLQRLGDYRQAGDVYREILDRLSDKLSPAADSGDDAALFISAAEVVRRAVLSWPDDARQTYAAADDTVAAPLLPPALTAAGAGDYKPLRDLTELHPLSATGITAAALLQIHYLQSGDFLAAAWLGQTTLDAAMLAPADQPIWLFRTALAHTLAGQATEADRLAAQLAADHPATHGQFFGQDIELSPTLQKLQAAGPALARYPAGSWMTLGGALGRSRIASAIPGMARPTPASATISPPATSPPVGDVSPSAMVRLLTLRFPALTPRRNLGGMQADREILLAQAAMDAGTGPSVFPVVDNGILYVSDGMRIMAADLDSGLPPPAWAATYPADRAAVYPFSRQSVSGPSARPATLTLTADSLLAVMGADANWRMGRVMGRQSAQAALVCLDRTTGREQWRTAPTDFPESTGPVRTLQLAGTPLVYHNSIYVLARGGEQAQFEDLYLICLSLTGQYRWSRYIVSANAFNPFTETMQQTAASELAVADGRVGHDQQPRSPAPSAAGQRQPANTRAVAVLLWHHVVLVKVRDTRAVATDTRRGAAVRVALVRALAEPLDLRQLARQHPLGTHPGHVGQRRGEAQGDRGMDPTVGAYPHPSADHDRLTDAGGAQLARAGLHDVVAVAAPTCRPGLPVAAIQAGVVDPARQVADQAAHPTGAQPVVVGQRPEHRR